MDEVTNVAPPPFQGVASLWLMLAVSAAASIAFLASLLWMSFVVGGHRYFLLGDDAMVSMRYAFNLVHGRGLSWNAGDRVQGYANIGWTLIMAASHRLPLPQRLMSLPVQLIALTVHLLTAWHVYLNLRWRNAAGAGLAAATLIAFNPSMFFCGACGYESGLQALFITVAFLPAIPVLRNGPGDFKDVTGNRWAAMPVWTALAFVVRADAWPLFAIGCVLPLARAVFATVPRQGRWKRAVAGIIAGAIIVAAVLIFQRCYYGDWLPNTFRLSDPVKRTRLRRGIVYLWKFVADQRQAVFVVGPIIYLLANPFTGSFRRWCLPSAFVIAGWLAYIVLSGGDVYTLSRLLIPVLPLMSVCTGLLIWQLLAVKTSSLRNRSRASRVPRDRDWAGWATEVLVGLLLASYVITAPRDIRRFMIKTRNENLSAVLAARVLQHHFMPGRTIAVVWQGVTPYLMPDYRFHDLLGRSDRRIASSPAHWGPPGHNKWDLEYSLGQIAPDAVVTIVYGDVTDADAQSWMAAKWDYGIAPSIWLDPSFRRYYRGQLLHPASAAETPGVHSVYARSAAP